MGDDRVAGAVAVDEQEAARLIRELDKIEGRETDPRVEAIANGDMERLRVLHDLAAAKPKLIYESPAP